MVEKAFFNFTGFVLVLKYFDEVNVLLFYE